jgi:O-antigen/teichoic acid export membrane protein
LFRLNLKNTFVYTLLGFLPLSFSLIFTPFYTQYLSKVDYGLLNLFTIISGVLVPFFSLGIDQAFGFLYWDYNKDKKKFGELISTTLYLVFFIGLIIIGLGFLTGPWLLRAWVKNGDQFTLWPFLTLSLIYPVFIITNRVLLYYYRNEEDIKRYSLLNISTLITITAGSIITVIYFKMGSIGAVEGRTIGFCVIVLLFLFYEIKKLSFVFNRNIAQSLIRMGGPLFFSTLVGSLAYVGDRIIIEQEGTLEVLGVYGFSVTIASVVEILMGALSNSLIPGIYKVILNENEEQYANTNFQLFSFIYGVIAAVVLITAIITPFIKLFISPNFHESILYIPLLCLSFVPRTFTQIFSLKFYKKKKTIYLLFLNIAYLAGISLSGIILYYLIGMKGMALAVFLTAMINMLAAYRLSKKLDPFHFQFRKLYILLAIISVTIITLHFTLQTIEYSYIFYLLPLIVFILASITIFQEEFVGIKSYFFSTLKKFSGIKNKTIE